MTPSGRLQRPNRLARLLAEPGGVRVSDAIHKATENLETIRSSCLETIDRCLSEIEGHHLSGGRKPSEETKDHVYRLSNEIHGLAGVFGLKQLGEAAYSLCELVDRLRASGAWRRDAVEVHVSALRLLRRPEHAPDPDAVLQGLRRVTERAPKPNPDNR